MICVKARPIIERKGASRGAGVTNHGAEGTVEAAAMPRQGGAAFTDWGKETVGKAEGRGE